MIIKRITATLLLLTLLFLASPGNTGEANHPEELNERSVFNIQATRVIVSASPTNLPTDAPTLSPSPTLTETPLPPKNLLPLVVPLIVDKPTAVGYGPIDYPAVVNPLTGTAIDDFALLERRPMVVKVTNYPRSVRPQSGLSRADHVYEYYMERGVSRFIAVFYGQEAEKIGPVRSGRFFDEHVFRMYDGIFVFGSADQIVLDYFLSLEDHIVDSFVLENITEEKKVCGKLYGSTRLCRDLEIYGYNNMFTNTSGLTKYMEQDDLNYRPDLSGLRFTPLTPPNGELGLNIFTRYSQFIYNQWDYSFEQGRYLRSEEIVGFRDPQQIILIPHFDKLTGEQISADNVVVLIVPHEFVKNKTTSEIVNIILSGAGNAYVFRDGYSFPAIWVRPNESGVLNLFSLNGEVFPLKPGNTWFQVVSEQTLVESTAGEWEFEFQLPEPAKATRD